MNSFNPKRILIIYAVKDGVEDMQLSIRHHLHVLESMEHDINYYNALEDGNPWDNNNYIWDVRNEPPAAMRNRPFDAIILHNTFLGYRWAGKYFYKWKAHFNWIRDLDCLKIAMPQDEYDHAELLDEWLFEWGISVIFSNFDEEKRKSLYPIMHDQAKFCQCFTGYIDDEAVSKYAEVLLPPKERSIDIVYRARNLPYWFGSAGQLKHKVAEIVKPRAEALGFNCDISTRAEDAIKGEKWLDFLASGKAVIGTESGSSAIDLRGEVKTQCEALLKVDQSMSFEEFSSHMPKGWDDYQFLTVGPRHFEAVITKTCQVLVEGHYDGVLKPDKHYVPINRDFSNLKEALEKLRDEHYIEDMVERCYQDIYLSRRYTYRAFAKQIEKVLINHQKKGQERAGLVSDNHSTNKMIAVLERKLIAERHQNALLYAMFLDTVEQLPERFAKALAKRVRARLKLFISAVGILALVIILVLVLFRVC